MIQIAEQAITKKHCAVRMCAADDGFAVAAIAKNGASLAGGWGTTLEAALCDMLKNLGMLPEKEEACMILT